MRTDTEIMPLSYLEPEIMLKTCPEWRSFWNPGWRPTNANPSVANYQSWFWRSEGIFWYPCQLRN